MTTTEELPTWDLDRCLDGFADLDDAVADLRRAIDELQAAAATLLPPAGGPADAPTDGPAGGLDARSPAAVATALGRFLEIESRVLARQRLVGAVLHGRVAADADDEVAATTRSAVQVLGTPVGELGDRLQRWVATIDLDEAAGLDVVVAAHRHPLQRLQDGARHRMGEEAEHLALDLRLSGSAAWSELNREVAAGLTGTLRDPSGDEREEPVAVLRALATSPDAGLRRAAFEAEIDAWRGAAPVLAATLNGAKGETGTLNRRRGWPDDLGPALLANDVERPVLEAMTRAVEGSLPTFRRYLRAKALELGHDGGLPWWDLLAPIGDDATVSWPDAVSRIRTAFAAFSPRLAAVVDRAVDERWIDAAPRAGKVSGAFCMATRDDEARILCNFDGTTSGMLSLAHELGHAFHATVLGDRPPRQRQVPMALAETASVFCEELTMEAALLDATPAEEVALLERDLAGATQIVVDIHSRFRFELALCEARAHRVLTAGELTELLTEAQAEAYGDAVEPTARHPYLWAVKRHYFTPFYNWPYTFGLLFALGVRQHLRDQGDAGPARYEELLHDTGVASPASLAARLGFDLADEAFWQAGLDVLAGRVDRFVERAAARTITPD